ncbi:HAD superfamily hydrolase [Halalkaliarchaeum sp. AArc-CO]|uniref:HAD family hydrolase n=1 Tax=Halalkaliarchaeum sp. AArc-CO TaxID=2866381 RepID=UPI00217EB7CD|nr:HAD hydrolase-like protein [Halalkaliarchaeum sp. AArc-CO]UWG51605.1 HAD superfamily hydrolase [Halalkaliarchaeum sp. AArc-CO]
MDGYDAVVYDLDGTLARLDVDWEAVAREAAAVYRTAGVDPPAGDLWNLLDEAGAHGVGEEVARLVCEREREGARRSDRLFLADQLVERASAGVPIGVCSLNCEDAVRIALAEHGLAESVGQGAIVGRDTVATRKPDPEPLLSTCRALSVDPERTLFVGDSPRDERTADRAGTGFAYVSELVSDRDEPSP